MHQIEAEALREGAATATRRRIAGDLERVTDRVAPILRHIEQHLFDPDLRYERIRRACQIRDNNRSTVFRQELGLAPAEYIRDCRFAVACELLRETRLDISRIAELVGYTTPQVFTAAFRRWAGMTPNAYRRQERRLRGDSEDTAGLLDGIDVPDLSPAAWRRFVNGRLEEPEADLLVRYLLDLYPSSRRNLLREILRHTRVDVEGGIAQNQGGRDDATTVVPSLRSLFAREDIERLMADVVWEDLRDKPWQEQRDLVRHHLRFTTPALFELLGEKSREIGRSDRQQGIGVARLALDAAGALEEQVREDGCSEYDARAWGWIGNAKRIALDFDGADKAFVAAQRRLPPETEAPLAASEVLTAKGMLRWYQRKETEALELQDRAIALARRLPQNAGGRSLLLQALAVRALIRRNIGEPEAAKVDLQSALELVDHDVEPHLRHSLFINLAFVELQLGDPAGARSALRDARKLLKHSRHGSEHQLRLRWVEGLVAYEEDDMESAEDHLSAVHRGLQEIDRSELAAVAALDLARTALARGDSARAHQLASEALTLFEAFSLTQDALVARIIGGDAKAQHEQLRSAIARQALTSQSLARFKQFASGIAENPLLRLARGPRA